MIDLDLVRQDPALFQKVCGQKNITIDIKKFLKVDEERKEIIKEVQEMQTKRNAVSKEVPTMKGAEKAKAIEDMKVLGESLKKGEEKLSAIEIEWNEMQLLLPSIPLPSVPVGKDDKGNVECRREGEPTTFAFEPKDHMTLLKMHGMVDTERAVKIAGARSYFLTGKGAELHLAILRYTMDSLIKKGWNLFLPPLMASRPYFTGTGFFPGSEEQIYAVGNKTSADSPVQDDELNLIGTSEVSVMSFHADETLALSDLPRKYAGYSTCFRREAGTYGKDTHGLYRIHQFEKVEQVVLCEADQNKALALFEEIRQNAEDVLKALNLPYRILDVCTGDMGRGKIFMQDIETWMPSRNSYGETHSCSYLGDFQCRRLSIKYKDSDGKKQFCHSLNNTCIASPRILIPIIETYQNKDGSIRIPDVLQEYMGGNKVIA
ncbi:MAG: serine--tRNA ligase [Candidatus Peribacteraceae bacterium]